MQCHFYYKLSNICENNNFSVHFGQKIFMQIFFTQKLEPELGDFHYFYSFFKPAGLIFGFGF